MLQLLHEFENTPVMIQVWGAMSAKVSDVIDIVLTDNVQF